MADSALSIWRLDPNPFIEICQDLIVWKLRQLDIPNQIVKTQIPSCPNMNVKFGPIQNQQTNLDFE